MNAEQEKTIYSIVEKLTQKPDKPGSKKRPKRARLYHGRMGRMRIKGRKGNPTK